MGSDSRELTLETLARGDLAALFALEQAKVLENIDNPNCVPGATRSITITVTYTPTGDAADEIRTETSIASKLAPRKPVKSTVFMGERDGKLVAVAYNPAQGSLLGDQDDSVLPIKRAAQQ